MMIPGQTAEFVSVFGSDTEFTAWCLTPNSRILRSDPNFRLFPTGS
jgi:hypothetical protein